MKLIERTLKIMSDKSLKLKDLADCLEVNGSVVSTWKSRNTNPPAEYFPRICDFLGVSLEYIYTGKENSNDIDTNEKYILSLYRQLSSRNKIKIEAILEEKLNQENELKKLHYAKKQKLSWNENIFLYR